jgi:hypothetical protein
MSEYRNFIQTWSGKYFDFGHPGITSICMDDIAVALSNLCRFTGHLDEFYSVAQHCVLTSYLVPEPFAFEALLHDAAEAYVNDISTPLKSLLPEYRKTEHLCERLIRFKFDLPDTVSPEVKKADLIMLATERRDLLSDDGSEWEMLRGISPTDEFTISPLLPRQARKAFTDRWRELYPEHQRRTQYEVLTPQYDARRL